MKRINLSVDIDSNEIFEEAITAAIKSQARQISREKISEELHKEITEQIQKVVDIQMQKIKGESWYKNYAEKIEKSIESQLIERLYKDVGEQVMVSLKQSLIEKFDIKN